MFACDAYHIEPQSIIGSPKTTDEGAVRKVDCRPDSPYRAYVLGWICSSYFSNLPLKCPYSIVAVIIRFKSWAVSAFSSR